MSDALPGKPDDGRVLADRYALRDELGRGGQAVTWKAFDRQKADEVVAVKELQLNALPDWKSLELFEREAETLESLDHPGIPAYVDHLHREDPGSRRATFFLVQEFVEGRNLQKLLEAGELFDEAEVADIVDQLLEIATYLHDHTPPVVHRDIKPSNILRRPDGRLALVDFGAVQVVEQDTAGGSTVIGTTGYLPIEQLMGRAQPASDLYAIGATAVHLLTRIHPAELEVERNRMRFHDRTDISEGMANFLERMTEPAAEDRFADAREARAALQWRASDTKRAEKNERRAERAGDNRLSLIPPSRRPPPPVLDEPAHIDAPTLAFREPPAWLEQRSPDALTHRMNLQTGGSALLSRKNYLEATPDSLRIVSRPHTMIMLTAITAPVLPFAVCGLTAVGGPLLPWMPDGAAGTAAVIVFIVVTLVSMAVAFNAAARIESPHTLEFSDGRARLEAGFGGKSVLLDRPGGDIRGFAPYGETVQVVTDDFHREPVLFGLSKDQSWWIAEALNAWLNGSL